ncbi:MAG: CoA-binding protein [Pseudomonadota bacterium]
MVSAPTDALITDILTGTKTVACLGASVNPARASYGVMAFLQGKGMRVIPVNPAYAGQTMLGEGVVDSLAACPVAIDMVDVFRRADAMPDVVDEVLGLTDRPRVLWTQLDVVHDTAAQRARAAGLTVVQDRCPKIEWARLGLARL